MLRSVWYNHIIMSGLDIRFVILTLDSIIVLALLMTLVFRLLNKTLANSASTPQNPQADGPKTIDQMNIDIPL